MTHTFPQFAKTTDPKVLDGIRRNLDQAKDFHRRACEFSEAQGVDKGTYYPNEFAGNHRVGALGGRTKPETGRWTAHPRGGWRPFKNNPLYAEMEAIQYNDEALPGLPETVHGDAGDGRSYIATPHPFIVDDAAYVGFSFPPDAGWNQMPDPALGGWEEIRASEFHKARETYNDRLQAKRD